ncbi:hypothetical protein PHYC_00163 [Phycisphaerales bacterium]|nr:hypothetical protein PHYC_00163 [Phycisphaerales bacterium]
MPAPAHAQWVRRLRLAARPSLSPDLRRLLDHDSDEPQPARDADCRALIDAFTDNAGHRRPVDRPLLSHLLRCAGGDMPADPRPDELAWWCCHTRAAYHRLPIDWIADGRLFRDLGDDAIETWTDAELSSLHALSWEGLRARSPAILSRITRAAEWLLAEVQPDNATERPWAVHFFAAMSLDAARTPESRARADLYAQTLLNNALVGRERPDRFSACILWDAANWLESASRMTWQRTPPLLAPLAPPSR